MTARRAALLAVLFPIAGCSDGWFGLKEEEDKLPGERVSVLLLERAVEADPELAAEAVTLPAATENASWPVPGGTPEHAPQHVAVPERLAVAWERGAGAGESTENMILSSPAIADGRAFVLDSESTVSAFALDAGQPVWSLDLVPDREDDDASLGGGVAYAGSVLYATTAFGDVTAIDAASGTILWQRAVGGVFRTAPAVADGRLFAVSADNRLFALDAGNGELLWTHEGIVEPAGLLGAAVPAVSGELVVAAYSSGEVFALRVENGRVAWSDSLILQGRFGSRTSLADIDASPVIDRDLVFAASQGGSLVAIDLRSGLRIWEREVASAETPWIAGGYLYVATVDAELVCLRRRDGRVRWVAPLPRFEDPEDREGPIVWTGPILAGGRLIVAGSNGELLEASPYDGAILGTLTLDAGVSAPPVVARSTLYVLTREADLVALR